MNIKHKPFYARFLFRWFVSSLGLWIAAGLLGSSIDYQSKGGVIIMAGLVLAIVNTLVKPLVVFDLSAGIAGDFGALHDRHKRSYGSASQQALRRPACH